MKVEFPGLKRVKQVYPIWFIIYLLLLYIMISLEIKSPNIILLLTIIFFTKTIVVGYMTIKIKTIKVYWSEHGPFLLLVFLIGIFDII